MSDKNDTRDEFPRRRGLDPRPAGIQLANLRVAAWRDGSLVLLARARVTAPDGETLLPFNVRYALDEPIPTLLLDGRATLEMVRPPVLPNRTRRCLLLRDADGRPVSLWLFLEPERMWAVAAHPKWIAGILDC